MLIIELDRIEEAANWVNVAPGTFQTHPGIIDIASWYTVGTSSTERMYITQFIENSTDFYTRVTSLSECLSTTGSFYWNDDEQILIVHFEIESSWYTSDYQYAKVSGYTDQDMVYIDDIEYLPLIQSAPGVDQQEDLVNYDKLAFISGSVNMDNKGHAFDYLVDEEIYGYGVQYKYLDSEDVTNGNATREDLIDLASLYIEDYDIGLQALTIRVQDRRKAQNAVIPKDVFTSSAYPNIDDDYIGKPIPLIYGPIAEFPAIPVTGGASGDVTFKLAKTLTAIGTIQAFEDDVWTTVTANSTDLTNGSFVLDYTDCRKGGTTTGDILDVRVLSCTGEAISDSADVIRLINFEAQGTAFSSSNYYLAEWAAEKKQLSQIGVAFTNQVEVYEAIRQIQNGSNVGFRYEIRPDGRRTIRIDDNNRSTTGTINNIDIQNIYDLEIQTDSEILAATVTVDYKKNYQEGEYRTLFDDTLLETVKKRYLQEPNLKVETFLQTGALAQDKADWLLDRYSTIPKVVPLILMGKRWYELRIYDTLIVELTPGFVDLDTDIIIGRSFFGIWKIKVLAISPQLSGLVNNVTAQLIEKIGG